MKFISILITIALLFLALIAPSMAGVGGISLQSNPSALPADGQSTCIITAQVTDSSGRPVPDGTVIQFSASLGSIESQASTVAGAARVRLASSEISGTSIITATWVEGSAVAMLSVPIGEVQQVSGPKYINVESDEYMAFSVDGRILEAIGNVKIRYLSLELYAHKAQIDLEKNRIVAKSMDRERPLTILTNKGRSEGNMFSGSISGGEGLLLSIESGKVQKIELSKSVPELSEEEPIYIPEQFDMYDLSESAMVIKSKAVTIFPNQKINFTQASIYVSGKRMVTLPYYVLRLDGYINSNEQYIGCGTDGLKLSFPLYYALTPSSSGALLVRHGVSPGWGIYTGQPGWHLDVAQKYNTDNSEGELNFNRVLNSDWGARFTHSQQLDPATNGYLYVDFPSHRDIFANVNLARSYKTVNVGLSIAGSNSSGCNSTSSDVYIQTKPWKLGDGPFTYNLAARTSYIDTSGVDSAIRQSLEGTINSMPLIVSPSISLRTSTGLAYLWGDKYTTGLSTIASAMVDCKLSSYGNLQLSYRYSDKSNVYSYVLGRQSLAASLTAASPNNNIRLSLYGIMGLDYNSFNLLGDLSYYFAPGWRFGVTSTINQYPTGCYNDLELALGKAIANRELILVWSKSKGRLLLELGSVSF